MGGGKGGGAVGGGEGGGAAAGGGCSGQWAEMVLCWCALHDLLEDLAARQQLQQLQQAGGSEAGPAASAPALQDFVVALAAADDE